MGGIVYREVGLVLVGLDCKELETSKEPDCGFHGSC